MKRLFAVLLVIVLLFVPGQAILSQTPPSPTAVLPSPAQAQTLPQQEAQKQNDARQPGRLSYEGEHRITRTQAEELFRSVDEILEFVSQDSGLPIRARVKRKLASRAQVEKFILRRMKDDEDAKRLQRSEVVLKKFGFVPRDFDLQTFLLGLLKEQVAGFYDGKTRTVYLLDWVGPEEQKSVLAHELTHALQDQNFGLEAMGKKARENDPTGIEADERLAALQAVTEGQAMLVLLDYSLVPSGSSIAEQPMMVDAMEAGLNATGPNMVMFNRAPLFLQQVLLFPYRFGTRFERDLLVAGGKEKAFAGALRNPPQDTRQILNPNTYLEGRLVPPLKPAEFSKLLPGYRPWDLSAVGEFDVVLLLRQHLSQEVSDEISREWRGGYYWAALTPEAVQKRGSVPQTGDLALAYVSRWSTPEAAQRFAGYYAKGFPRRYSGATRIDPEAKEIETWQTSEGLLTITVRGDEVLVTEGFDGNATAKIRSAVMP